MNRRKKGKYSLYFIHWVKVARGQEISQHYRYINRYKIEVIDINEYCEKECEMQGYEQIMIKSISKLS